MKNILHAALIGISLSAPLCANAQIITTVAGSAQNTYGGDGGAATVALISMPMQIAVDGSGNVFIADQGNFRIRKVSSSGTITTFAGNGFAGSGGDGGAATAAEVNASGVAVDGAGNVYIADTWNNKIRVVNTAGNISTIAGNGTLGYAGDGGAATAAELNEPSCVAIDATGNVYIADNDNHRIRMVNTSGIISTIAGTGVGGFSGDGGAAVSAMLKNPSGVAVDAYMDIYIADQMNARIRKIDAAGNISTIAGNGTLGYSGDGGAAISAEFYQPSAVTLDAAGNVYVADQSNNRVRMINTLGIVSTVAGNGAIGFGGDGGPAVSAMLDIVTGVAVDAAGNLYAADEMNNRIRVINTAGTINTLAGSGLASLGDGGPATDASLNYAEDVEFDASGTLYICDNGDNKIRKVNSGSIISTVAGTSEGGYNGDGIAATSASLDYPFGICFDAVGDMIICDDENARIRKVDASGIISTIAGTGHAGYSGDGGPATDADLSSPQTIAIDAHGNIFFSDNNRYIREISTAGIISSIAGAGPNTGMLIDGSLAANVQFGAPGGLSFDPSGNMYVCDYGNHTIWRIDVSGYVHLFAGNYTSGNSGDGGPATDAELKIPVGSCSDAGGNIFIADEVAEVVRKIDVSGNITTVAGNGMPGYSGDGGAATAATLNTPVGVRTNDGGQIFIADRINRVIRMVASGATPLSTSQLKQSKVTISPNPSNGIFTINATRNITQVQVSAVTGQVVCSFGSNSNSVTVNLAHLPAGNYFVWVNGTYAQQVVIE